MATPRIFISMGTPYTPDLAQFREMLHTYLRDQCGTDPRIIGKNEYPEGNPLAKIRQVMATCHGVVIVAYERKFVDAGTEKRISASPVPLANKTYTTPWNHIESAMAYSLDLPIYIICQNGLTEEGLIESKLDWYVNYCAISPTDFQRTDFTGSLSNWVKTRVVPRSRLPRFFKTIEGSVSVADMTPKEIFGVIGIIAAAFSAGVAAVKFFPMLFG